MANETIIRAIENAQKRTDVPRFRGGDTVRVHAKVVEGGKERIQIFGSGCSPCRRKTENGSIPTTGSRSLNDSGPPDGERITSPRRQEIVVATLSMSQPALWLGSTS